MYHLFRIVNFSVIVAVVFALSACGTAVRTADGDCYYRGKGLLALGATVLDGLSAYADAELEAEYQRDQIELQRLGKELDSINANNLRSDHEISVYNDGVDRYNSLLAKVDDYQEKKQRGLKDGPATSFSKQVDESGDCK